MNYLLIIIWRVAFWSIFFFFAMYNKTTYLAREKNVNLFLFVIFFYRFDSWKSKPPTAQCVTALACVCCKQGQCACVRDSTVQRVSGWVLAGGTRVAYLAWSSSLTRGWPKRTQSCCARPHLEIATRYRACEISEGKAAAQSAQDSSREALVRKTSALMIPSR